jgi:predicted nucleotidyltransferase
MKSQEVLQSLRAFQPALARHHVASLALFGSVARNEARPESDIDILVEFCQPVGLFEFVQLKRLLESILGHPVDLVTPDALRESMRAQILDEAIYA